LQLSFFLRQALETLGIITCETTTLDFALAEIIAVISINAPPHGDNLLMQKKIYGEPSKSKDEAIEPVHASTLLYLLNVDTIFVDDANLQELSVSSVASHMLGRSI
jgi:hypothetical protein